MPSILRSVLSCSVMLIIATSLAAAGEGNEVPIAFGGLSSLRPGTVWTYSVRNPQGNIVGAPEGDSSGIALPALGPQNFETRLVRIHVSDVARAGDDTVVRLRIEQERPPSGLTTQPPCDVTLRQTPTACTAEFLREGNQVDSRIRYDYGRVPILCYPLLRGVPPRDGEKVLDVPSRGDTLHAFQATPSADGVIVTVEAREYVIMPGPPSEHGSFRQTWTEFYDAEANDIVGQPREGREMPWLLLRARELQEWDIGQPFAREIRRWTPDHQLLLSCTLISGPDGPIVRPERTPFPRLRRPGEGDEPAGPATEAPETPEDALRRAALEAARRAPP